MLRSGFVRIVKDRGFDGGPDLVKKMNAGDSSVFCVRLDVQGIYPY